MDRSTIEDLRLVQSDEPGAFAALEEKYRPLIISLVDSFLPSMPPNCTLGRDDLLQEANIALYRAAMRYDTNQDKVTFGLFAKVCIRNRLVSTLRRQRRLSKKPPAKIPESTSRNESPFMIQREALRGLLTQYEEQVLQLRIENYSYKEIAKKLATDPKSVDNAMCRVRKKIKDMNKNTL